MTSPRHAAVASCGLAALALLLGACGQCGADGPSAANDTAPTPDGTARAGGPPLESPPPPEINLRSMLLEELPAGLKPLAISFGPLGNHVAWLEDTGVDRVRLTLDGRPGPEFVGLGEYLWSRDGLQLVYSGHTGPGEDSAGGTLLRRWYVLVGAERYGPFARVDSTRLADDGAVTWRATYSTPTVDETRATRPNVALVVDGVADPKFLELPPSGMVFDRAGRIRAYRARSEKGWHLVRKGKVGPPYDRVSDARFSADGAVMAYIAGKRGEVSVEVVVNGKASRLPFGSVRDLTPFDDGRVAAVADRRVLITDVKAPREAWIEADRVSHLQRVGSRLAYVLDKDGKTRFVMGADTHALPQGASVRAVDLSPAGKRFMVRYRVGTRSEARVGKATWPSSAVVKAVTWSSDGARLAYVMTTSGPVGKDRRPSSQATVVLDGKTLGPFEAASALSFSPSGERFAFVARGLDGVSHVWVDGKPRRDVEGHPMAQGAAWSDNDEYFFGLVSKGRARLVWEGGKTPFFEALYPGRFSNDGSRFGAGVRQGRELRWLVTEL